MNMPFRMPVAASADATTYEHLLLMKRNAAVEIVAGLEGYLKARYQGARRVDREAAKDGAIDQLSAGLLSWLTLDIDATLEGLKHAPAPGMLYKPSIEEFARASETVEVYERQWNAIQDNLQKVPEDYRPILSMALPMLENQLRDARDYRDRLQKALESAEQQEAAE